MAKGRTSKSMNTGERRARKIQERLQGRTQAERQPSAARQPAGAPARGSSHLFDQVEQAKAVADSDWLAAEPELEDIMLDPERLGDAFVREVHAQGHTMQELDEMATPQRLGLIDSCVAKVLEVDLSEEDRAMILAGLESATHRLGVEGNRGAAIRAGIVYANLSRPENAAAWPVAGLVKQIALWSITTGLGVVDEDERAAVDDMVEVLEDLDISLAQADLVLGLYTQDELDEASRRIDRALAAAGLPLIGSDRAPDADELDAAWNEAASGALRAHIQRLMSPQWIARIVDRLDELIDSDVILDDDWFMGTAFMADALESADPSEVVGLLMSAMLGEMIDLEDHDGWAAGEAA